MSDVYKLSNAGGFKSLNHYINFLSGNSTYVPIVGYNSLATTYYSTGSGGDVTFSNVPTGYRHLQIRAFVRDTRADTTATWFLQFNADTGTNYSYHGMEQNGTSIGSVSSINTNSIQGITSAGQTGSSRFAAAVIDIFDANQTNKFKTVTYQSGFSNNGNVARLYTAAGTWRNTNAITSISFKPNTAFAQYSHIALYGIE